MTGASPHVCLVTDFPLVLDGRVLNQAYTLSRAGYRVTIVDQGLPRKPDRLAPLYRRLPGWVSRSCRVVRLAAGDDGFPAGLYLALQRPARPLGRRLVSRALVRLRAGVYQARNIETLRTVVPAARRVGAKVVYDVRDFYAPQWQASADGKLRRAVRVEQRAVPYVSAMTTVNESLASAVARHYQVPPPEVILNCKLASAELPPGVRDLRRELGFGPEVALLAFTGTSTIGRSLPVIITAIGRMPGVHLAFVGIADRGGEFARLAHGVGAGTRVSFHPPVPAYEVPAYIRSADAAIACIEPLSPNHARALPNKVFEAVAAHLPLIASDLPEMRRVVETYRLGRVFDPSDADALVRAATGVLAEREQFRQNAIAASRELCWEREGEKLLAVYRRLIGPP
jgi:glycosyltransferase involved in cell wall biosynthesis